MKQVFESRELAHVWANQQQSEGRNSGGNFYFKNGTIYSYGSHFPIATIKDNDVFFTMQSYSNTTAKHISRARGAVSHKHFIWVNDVPVDFRYLSSTHENNMKYWKRQIKAYFSELGNKRIRDTQGRINEIERNISQLNEYCSYFKLKIEDKELKGLLKMATNADFIEQARAAKEKETLATEKKMKQAGKAFDLYIDLWRQYKDDEIENLPEKTKDLCRIYRSEQTSYTRLRYNAAQERIETSKGVQIPIQIAHKAFIALNGCMVKDCNKLSIPVMNYTITETKKDCIIAGCHTIPKTDINYIASLLNW